MTFRIEESAQTQAAQDRRAQDTADLLLTYTHEAESFLLSTPETSLWPLLLSIMENDARGVSFAAANLTDSVTHDDTIKSS
jgi:hypothetical protein